MELKSRDELGDSIKYSVCPTIFCRIRNYIYNACHIFYISILHIHIPQFLHITVYMDLGHKRGIVSKTVVVCAYKEVGCHCLSLKSLVTAITKAEIAFQIAVKY